MRDTRIRRWLGIAALGTVLALGACAGRAEDDAADPDDADTDAGTATGGNYGSWECLVDYDFCDGDDLRHVTYSYVDRQDCFGDLVEHCEFGCIPSTIEQPDAMCAPEPMGGAGGGGGAEGGGE